MIRYVATMLDSQDSIQANRFATNSYVVKPIIDAGTARISLSVKPRYNPRMTLPLASWISSIPVLYIPPVGEDDEADPLVLWIRVLMMSKGYPTAHATVAANAPEVIGTINSSYVDVCSWSTNADAASPVLSVITRLLYSYATNHTPCGIPSLRSVALNPRVVHDSDEGDKRGRVVAFPAVATETVVVLFPAAAVAIMT